MSNSNSDFCFWPPAKKNATYLIYKDIKQRKSENSSHLRSYNWQIFGIFTPLMSYMSNQYQKFHSLFSFQLLLTPYYTYAMLCERTNTEAKHRLYHQYPLTPSLQRVTFFLPLKQTELFKSWNQCTSPEILVHANSLLYVTKPVPIFQHTFMFSTDTFCSTCTLQIYH